jgi:hypothetical protein
MVFRITRQFFGDAYDFTNRERYASILSYLARAKCNWMSKMERPLASTWHLRFPQLSHPLTIALSFICHDTPTATGVSPGQTYAVGTLSINCIGTRQYIGVGMNLARIERLNLIIDW